MRAKGAGGGRIEVGGGVFVGCGGFEDLEVVVCWFVWVLLTNCFINT